MEEERRPSRNASKRAYTQDENSNDEADSHHEAEEESGEEEEVSQSRQRAKRSRINTDALLDDVSDDDEEEENARPRNDDGSYAGQIRRIYVENFMCHRKLTMDFNKHLTFVGGVNGSGKSAIAVALMVCLGSTAKSTGRGSANASFIREGSNGPAIVKVYLRNEGSDAYEPKKYGKTIVVVRKIFKPSGGHYELLNHKEELVTKEKRELENILRAFNIYVDNPCCVLTQEESKKFIQGHEKEKYEFFLKATGLHRIKDELDETKKAIDDCEGQMRSHKDRLIEKLDAFKEMKSILDRLTALDKTEDDIKLCRAKAYWDDHRVAKTTAEAREVIVAEKRTDLEEAQAALEALIQGGGSEEDQLTTLTERAELMHEEIGKAEKELGLKAGKSLALSKSLAGVKSELSKQMGGKTEISGRIKTANKELENLRRLAREEAEKGEVELRKVLQKLETISSEIISRQEREGVMKEDLHSAAEEANNLGKQLMQLQAQLNGLGRNVQRTEEKLNSQSDVQGKAKMFGNSVPQILNKIQTTRFSKPVLGPIGMCISMKEGTDQWSQAVEKSLISSLKTFVVSTSEDRATLATILKTFNAEKQHSIILQPPHARYAIPLSADEVTTVADTLVIADDQVFNALVDQTGMERMALISEEEHYRQFVTVQNGREMLKYNLTALIAKNGTTLKYADGNRSSEVNRSAFQHQLSNDNTAYRESLRQQLQAEQQEYRDVQAQLNELKRGNGEIQDRPKQIERAIRENSMALQQLGKSRNELEANRAEMQTTDRFDTKDTEDELAELHRALDEVNLHIAATETQIQTINVELKTHQTEKRDAERVVDALRTEVNELQTEMERLISRRQDLKRQRDGLTRNVANKQLLFDKEANILREVTVLMEEKLTIAKAKAEELIDGADVVLEKKETRHYLERKERELRVQLEEGRRLAGVEGYTKEGVTAECKELHEDYTTFKKDFERLRKNLETLQADYEERDQRRNRSLKSCAKKARNKFDDYVQKKGFAGTIKFDHEECTLSLTVMTDSSDANTTSKDVKQLSGGERSYVTFSLLLALGHVIECPFRLMDEYDVFLDEHARKVTLDQLVAYSKSPIQRDRQFIVITPNKLNELVTGKDVQIVKMKDPKRASAHGLQQQTIN